jgi:hypothetical protein
MSINSLEKYISNRLTNHLMRTGLLSFLLSLFSSLKEKKGGTYSERFGNILKWKKSFLFTYNYDDLVI